jgi:integrase
MGETPPEDGLRLGAAITRYETEDAAFRSLASSTKYEYRLLLKELGRDLGDKLVAEFTPAVVDRLKNLWARRGHRAANVRLQVLRNVLWPCLVAGDLPADPFALVSPARRPSERGESHLVWPDEVFEAVMRAALDRRRFGLARAVAIARFVGARRGDLVRMPLTARANGRIRYQSAKRKVWVDVPEDPRLTTWLAMIPAEPPEEPRRGRKVKAGRTPAQAQTLVVNLAGKPYTPNGLAEELAKLVRELRRQGALESRAYGLHGLRHTLGVELALAGCSDAEGAAMLGHESPSSFTRYRRQAARTALADAAASRLAARRLALLGTGARDGTAPPDRTGDLQSHNLAL